jgi:hypothetical protein
MLAGLARVELSSAAAVKLRTFIGSKYLDSRIGLVFVSSFDLVWRYSMYLICVAADIIMNTKQRIAMPP